MAIANHGRSRLSIAELTTLINTHFPQVQEGNGRIAIEFLGAMSAHVRMAHDEGSLRPGGTVSGPAMFKLADFTVYAAILGECGADALEAADMVGKARIIQLARRLA